MREKAFQFPGVGGDLKDIHQFGDEIIIMLSFIMIFSKFTERRKKEKGGTKEKCKTLVTFGTIPFLYPNNYIFR